MREVISFIMIVTFVIILTSLTVKIFRAVSQVSSIASSSRDPQLCDQMKGSLIKKQVTTSVVKMMKIDDNIKESGSLPLIPSGE